MHSHCDETDDYSDDSEGEEDDPEDEYSDGDDYGDDFDRYLSSVEEEERELTKMLAETTAKPLNQTISAWGMEGVKVTFDTEALELIASQVRQLKIFRQKAATRDDILIFFREMAARVGTILISMQIFRQKAATQDDLLIFFVKRQQE